MSTPEHVGPEPRRRDRGGAVAAAEVEHLEPVRDRRALDQRLAAVAHARGDAGEVALFPERFVRIHRRSPPLAIGTPAGWLRPPGIASASTKI